MSGDIRTIDVFSNQIQHLFATVEKEASKSFHHDHIHDPLYYTADVIAQAAAVAQTANNTSISSSIADTIRASPSLTPSQTTQAAAAATQTHLLHNNTIQDKPIQATNIIDGAVPTTSSNTTTTSSSQHMTPSHSRSNSGTSNTLPRPSSNNNVFATPASPRLTNSSVHRSNSHGSHTHSHSHSHISPRNSPRASPRTLNVRNLHSNFRVDVTEHSDRYVIVAVLPSCKQEELNINVSDNMLTVSADRKQCCSEHAALENSVSQHSSPQAKHRELSGQKHNDNKDSSNNTNATSIHTHNSPKILYGMKVSDKITQSLLLPPDVDTERVTVSHEGDTLKIDLPKLPTATTNNTTTEPTTLSPSEPIQPIPEDPNEPVLTSVA